MRQVAAVVIVLALAACASASPPPQRFAEPDVDILLARLQRVGDPGEAERIETLILEAWSRSGNPAVDALMVEGVRALYRGDSAAAVGIFSDVVEAVPDFVDGWRWRGTALYLAGEDLAAIRDLRRALALEPRHFGAWLAVAQVFAKLEALDEAMYAYRMALGIDPHLDEARQRLRALERRAAGLPV